MLLIPLNHKRRVFIFLQDYVKTDLKMYNNEWEIKFIKLLDCIYSKEEVIAQTCVWK